MADQLGPWRKSSYSGNESNCVELAHADTAGAVRDSKNPAGPHLRVDLPTMITAVQAGVLPD